MTSTMPSSIDPHGNCVHHPFVQLQRLSPRTGEWKALLDSCPLCALDTRSTCSSVCSSALGSVCSGLEVERTSGGASRRRASDNGSTGSGSGGQRGRGRAPSLEHALVALDHKEEERHARPARARSTSRVRFGGASECDVPYSKAKSTSFHVVSSPDPHNPYVVGRSSSASLSGMRDISPGAASLQGGGASVSSQSVSTRSALKAPKYKPCPKEMRRQLDESERVTTMSMDLNMSLNDDGSVEIPGEEDYPDYYGGYDNEEQEREEERLQIEHEARQHEQQEEHNEEEEEEESVMIEAKEVKKELQLPLLTASPGSSHEDQDKEPEEEEPEEEEHPPSRRSSTESNASGSSRRRHRSKERRSSAMDNNATSRQEQKSSKPRPQRSSSCQIGYRSDEYSQVQAKVQVSRPDPEEYPCGASLSSQDRTQPRRNGRQPRSGPPVTSSNNPNGYAARQVRSGSFTSGVVPPPPPPFPTLQPTSAANRYGSTVVAQPGYDDEVSTLSFMGNSVRSESVQGSPTLPAVGHVNAHPANANAPSNNGSCENHHGSDKTLGELTNPNNGESSPEASTHEPMPQVNTNDYDAKGKCKHHPHIRLRKKKLFGRGWKVLMSACPDCCVDELRRIRLVEENKRKMAAKAEARGLERSLDKSERSVGTANSGTSRASRASRKSSNKRTSSNHSVRSHGSHQSNRSAPANNGAQSNRRHSQLRSSMESNASSRVPPPPPPRRSPSVDSTRNSAHKPVRSSSAAPTSPSHDARHEMVAKTLNKHAANKARRPSDETASLTGSSSGSSNGQSGVDASNRSSIDASLRSSGESSIPASPGVRSPSLDNVAASLNRNYQSSPMGNSLAGTGPAASEKKRRASSKSNRRDSSMSAASSHSRSSQQAPPGPPRGSIHVRKMQWTDVKNGRNGQYTGQVDAMFAPHGSGIMEYDDGSSREGMWKNGRFRKSGGGSGGSVKSGRSAGSSSRSRSKGRDGGSARSRSRSAGRSVSRQPQMPVAI